MPAPSIAGVGVNGAAGYSPRRLASYSHSGDRLYVAGYGNHANMTSAQFNAAGLGATVADILHSSTNIASLKLWTGTPAGATANADVLTTNYSSTGVAAFSIGQLASVGTIQTAQGVGSPATITGTGGDADTAWLCLINVLGNVAVPAVFSSLSHAEVFSALLGTINQPNVVAMKATGNAPVFSLTHNQVSWSAILIPLQGASVSVPFRSYYTNG